MKIKTFLAILLLISLSVHFPVAAWDMPSQQVSRQAIQAPVLKWQRGGCYSSWCETGWYSSPAVSDLDGDGAPEVIGSAYSIFILDGVQRKGV